MKTTLFAALVLLTVSAFAQTATNGSEDVNKPTTETTTPAPTPAPTEQPAQ